MKYDFDLDVSSKNSLSLIIKKIRPGSTVLEFGPAAGRMTKYLKEQLNCKVYIVEIDEVAAKKASFFAEDVVIGNIEDFKWFEQYKNVKFDHIIFADVLEHLYNPQIVMNKCVELLKIGGSLLISVPNIAHNSVIIDLLHNKFEYRKTGLLDDTHIRFFTYTSLINMISTCNLAVKWEDAIIKRVGETELGNFFDGLPNGVVKFLKNRPLCDLYQFVMELQPQQENSSKIRNVVTKGDYYYSQLYVDCGDGITEEQSLTIRANASSREYEFDLIGYEGIERLRFDPLNVNCIINIEEIVCIDKNGEQLVIDRYGNNADFSDGSTFLFLHEDPQILFDSPRMELSRIIVRLSCIDYEFSKPDWLLGKLRGSEYKIQSIEKEYTDLLLENSNLKLKNKQFEVLLEDSLEKSKESIEELLQRISSVEERSDKELILRKQEELKVSQITEELNMKTEELNVRVNELNKIYSTILGKLIARMIK
ncbi:class I SAM-dependent methyltransferase [Paenibacillus odorifer]|uniref:class I SAM-dependent methyltransferase n=1 Tax=Paenibacillus odorifer TaxID=189426 RepID=UPI0013A704B4|nr:class I SAM-dependent methyltransferase [Paenibacillus odorifer]